MSGTAVDDNSTVAGLEGGADDYIFKPVSMTVLLARVHSVLRRAGRGGGHERVLERHGVRIDFERHSVEVGGKAISLSRKEFALLASLIEASGRVLTKNYLLENLWGYDLADYNNPRTIEVHVSRLRKKLGVKAGALIETISGVGYKFDG